MGFFQSIRDFAHRYDPIGANLTDNAIRNASRVTAEGSRFLDNTFFGGSSAMGRFTRDEARKNIADPARAVSRAAATVALMYGFGAFGGGAAAGAGAGATETGITYAGASEGVLGQSTLTGGSLLTSGAGESSLAGYGAAVGGGGAAGYYAGDAAASAATNPAAGGTNTASPPPSSPESPYGRALRSFGTGVATNLAISALTPKPPAPTKEPEIAMPDPEAQAAAKRRKLIAQRNRQGRAASILTTGY